MVIYDESGHSSGDTIARGSLVVSFESGGFVFPENKKTYAFEFFLVNAPTGVTLADKSFSERTLTVGAETPDGAHFSVQIKAWAVGHEDAPCYGTPFDYVVYNPAGTYPISDLPGLQSLEALVNGVPIEEQPLGPGSYTVSLRSVPEDYISTHHASVTYFEGQQTISSASDMPSFSGTTLTLPSNVNETFAESIGFWFSNDFGSYPFNLPYSIRNTPASASNHYSFPGLRAIHLSYQNKQVIRSNGGDYDIDISYVMEEGASAFNPKNWLIKIFSTYAPNFLYDFTDLNGPLHVTVPTSVGRAYYESWFSVVLYSTSNPSLTFTSTPFYFLTQV